MHRSTSTQRERYYKDLSYLLVRNNTRNVAVVHAYTRKGGLERTVKKKGKKGQIRAKKEKRKEKKGKKSETKNFIHTRRAQAESRGDKVAVCWHNQSHDMSR